MKIRITAAIVIVWLAAVLLPGTLQGQMTKRAGGGDMIRPSGLQPVFPDAAACPEIASPFGSDTRYDGSSRPGFQFGGYHGGIDVSLAEGTLLLALAAGTVATKGEGGQLEGIYLWLRHSPEDTGLTYWVFSKYQHLESHSELAIGAKVVAGQVIARSGKTGTVGGHYRSAGYPHLHLTTRKNPNGEYQIMDSGQLAAEAPLFDPLVIYHEAGLKSAGAPPREKTVAIPYATPDGQLWPKGTRVVWPVACRPR
jgi:murein DD-endopeptidase MepM/ murein hydrolase activator NlpD